MCGHAPPFPRPHGRYRTGRVEDVSSRAEASDPRRLSFDVDGTDPVLMNVALHNIIARRGLCRPA